MPDNKIVIGKQKIDKSKNLQDLKQDYKKPQAPEEDPESISSREYLDDNIWGSDPEINKKLDKELLLERRRYVRVRYFQEIKCMRLGPETDVEPIKPDEPVILSLFDISMGGLGTVCSHEIKKGSVLFFNLQLDHLTYDIKCKVAYCVQIEDNYRIGLKILDKDSQFIKHLKIVVARISLNAKYAAKETGDGR